MKIPKPLFECLSGQILSLLFAYKYTFPLNPTTFTTDVCLVPLTCLIFLAFRIRRFNERNLKGGFLSGVFYFLFIKQLVGGSNIFNIDFTLLVFFIGFFISLLFKYLFLEKVNFSYFQYFVYVSVFIISAVLILSKASLSGSTFMLSSNHNIISCTFFVSYTVVTNILTNEIGIIEYLVYSSVPPVFMCMLSFYLNQGKDIYNDSLIENITYYVISLILYVGSVIYLQVYGIVSFNFIHASNLLLFLIMRNYDKVIVGGMYISLIITKLLNKV